MYLDNVLQTFGLVAVAVGYFLDGWPGVLLSLGGLALTLAACVVTMYRAVWPRRKDHA